MSEPVDPGRVPSLAEDRDAIRDLLVRYCLHLHDGDIRAWASLYTDDGVFHGAGDEVVGRAALEAYGDRAAAGGLHRMVLNPVMDVDGDQATCRATIMLLSGGAVASIGRTTDELRRVDGAWRIARRTFVSD